MEIHPTKQRIIETTAKLMRKKGYSGLGITEILTQTELPKGSLYHHFPGGKDDLVIEALRFFSMNQALAYKEAMKGKATAVAGLQSVIDVLITDFEQYGRENGCPLTTVALDVAHSNERIRLECSKQYDFWVKAIQSYLAYKQYPLPKAKAVRFMTALEGAVVLGIMKKTNEYLDYLKEDVELLLAQ